VGSFREKCGGTWGVLRCLATPPNFTVGLDIPIEGVEDAAVEGGGAAASIDCSWRMWEDHIGGNALSG
jgi:hypothetical protein